MSYDPAQRPCGVTWGNCTAQLPNPRPREEFGKPTATPHVCQGECHRLKFNLHICTACRCLGAVHRPSKFSKAGAEYAKLLKKATAIKSQQASARASAVIDLEVRTQKEG